MELSVGKNVLTDGGVEQPGVGNGVVVLQLEQRRQFFLVELIHTAAHIMRQDEIEEGPNVFFQRGRRR